MSKKSYLKLTTKAKKKKSKKEIQNQKKLEEYRFLQSKVIDIIYERPNANEIKETTLLMLDKAQHSVIHELFKISPHSKKMDKEFLNNWIEALYKDSNYVSTTRLSLKNILELNYKGLFSNEKLLDSIETVRQKSSITVKAVTTEYNLNNCQRPYKESTVRSKMKSLGFRFKKAERMNPMLRTMNNFEQKKKFIRHFSDLLDKEYQFIFVDECSIGGKMTHSHENTIYSQTKFLKTSSLILATSKSEVIYFKIVNETTDSNKFLSFMHELSSAVDLHPELGKLKKEAKLIYLMDNAKIHRSQYFLKNFDNQGVKILFNVPYEPRFNSVELCFNKIKQNLKHIQIDNLSLRTELVKNNITEFNKNCLEGYYRNTLKEILKEILFLKKYYS